MLLTRYIFAISIVFLFANEANSQNSKIKKGDFHYEKTNFTQALDYYLKIPMKEIDDDLKRKISDCFFQLRMYDSALYYIESIPDSNLTFEDWLSIGDLNYTKGNYHKSDSIWTVRAYENNQEIRSRRCAISWAKMHNTIDTTLTISQLNVDNIARSNGLFFTNRSIVYSAYDNTITNPPPDEFDSDNMRYTNIFQVDIENKQAVNLRIFSEELLFRYHEGGVSITADNQKLFFSKTDIGRNRNTLVRIFDAVEKKGKWYLNMQLPFDSAKYECSFPAIAPDGSFMIFVANYNQKFSKKDLYISYNENGTWQQPVNMGIVINSPGNETFPYIDKNNNLYYSSDWFFGFGGYDIFFCKYENNSWRPPQNMNKPINSSFDDYSFALNSADARQAILASNRDSSSTDKIFLVESNRPFDEKNYTEVNTVEMLPQFYIEFRLPNTDMQRELENKYGYKIQREFRNSTWYFRITNIKTKKEATRIQEIFKEYSPIIFDVNQ